MARASAAGLGKWGEQRAAEELQRAGMTVLERNWRCSLGEIDIVAVDGSDLVIVEVKTRRDDLRGSAASAVTPAKLARLRTLARQWLASRPPSASRYRAVRIDVIAITRPLSGAETVLHLRGVE